MASESQIELSDNDGFRSPHPPLVRSGDPCRLCRALATSVAMASRIGEYSDMVREETVSGHRTILPSD